MNLRCLPRLLHLSHKNGPQVVRKMFAEGCLPDLPLAAAAAARVRSLHIDRAEDTPTKTVRDIICSLTSKVGAAHSFSEAVDRSHLLKLLPQSQEELPPRTMKDSWDAAIIPLGSEKRLREKYVTFMGGVRVGRLLEDLDVFAVWLCYKHLKNPRQTPDLPSPYSVVTALVDRIDFNQGWSLHPERDIRISGHVSWAGRSSMETIITVEQRVDHTWRQVTRAVFVMVARDPLNQGSAIVNPLVCETPEEQKIFQAGEVNKLHRKVLQEESLFRVPPNETEKTLVHELFMSLANPKELSFTSKNVPENSMWMEQTKLKNLIICHPEHRNRFKKVFGGFIMRQAYELGWACAFTISKQRPRCLHIDDIMFRRPVEVGSLLYLNSQVVYTEGCHMQISTKASVMDAATSSKNLTNIFHFTYETDQPVPTSIPKTYHEAMLYLDGRRHYQLVRGVRKFYGQGETKSDTSL
ncbi:acyl-coenzyme A thioesterase 9, mitochondrial-like isoform X1 [Eriocheir sinensis]|uniref:acyl-coenzyme A thioesterase 9, mitochondrial-like isoform X1 n=1 Tax=Eriocheir sinensis TaxID=95602 RepID=UPI0021C9A6C2|nr:acyl-coenzyme A thioesterase 9, mitochondrial-like isoform X1 [Eriocheir sinensis]